jgi:hypothetical protein
VHLEVIEAVVPNPAYENSGVRRVEPVIAAVNGWQRVISDERTARLILVYRHNCNLCGSGPRDASSIILVSFYLPLGI